MASIPHSGRPGGGVDALGLGVALLAAAAFGFLAFAMPADIFAGLVAQSRLSEIVAAAEPPLGMKARGAAIAAAAILTFTFVLLLFRAIDRVSARPARTGRAAAGARPEPEADAPRLRRADSHPDAPSRRPLLAGRDLGDLIDPDDAYLAPADEMFADLPTQPLPGFLAGEEPGAEALDETETQGEEEPLLLETPIEPVSVEALVSQLPEVEDAGDESITHLMQRLESGLVRGEPPHDETAPVPVSPVARLAEAPSWLAPESEFAAAEDADREPIAPVEEGGELRWPPEPVEPGDTADAVAPPEEIPPLLAEKPVGHRLRNAIGDMQRMAGRGG